MRSKRVRTDIKKIQGEDFDPVVFGQLDPNPGFLVDPDPLRISISKLKSRQKLFLTLPLSFWTRC